jgi:hypothetical protein
VTKKFFTVEEATRLLPEIIPILEQLIALHRSIGEAHPEVKRLGKIGQQQNGGGARGSQYLTDYGRLTSQINRLHAMGVLLKDIERGLIDFPHLREGREVYLCWHLGEEKIAYWHEIHAGYAGRQPL